MIRAAGRLLPLLLLLARVSMSQTVALSLTSGSGAPGSTVTLDLSLSSGGVPVSGLQWKIHYWAVDISSIQVLTGPAATAAGKAVSCAPSADSYICLFYGFNANTVADGVVAHINLQISPTTTSLVSSIRAGEALAAMPNGSALVVPAVAVGVVSLQQPPLLSGLGCSPAHVVTPGTATCSIVLQSPAPADGLKAQISSGNQSLMTPASVTIAAGYKTASFSVAAQQVSAKAQVLVTVSLGSLTQSTTVVLEPSDQAFSVSGIVNAASYLPGPVSPGEIVSIFGSGLGPAVGVVMQAGSGQVASTLSDVRVLFGGVPAPLLFVRSDVINAVAPYGMAGPSTQLQVEYHAVLSNAVTVPVAETSPGIFAIDASGSGQGAILNQDTSINSPANPVATGDVVIIYATGAGPTKPASVDGRITIDTDLPKPTGAVQVFIGGLKAAVLYAGAAPGLVAGALQVNARIPTGVASGPKTPVKLVVSGVESQPGMTLAVQ